MKKNNLHFRRFELKYPMRRALADKLLSEVLDFMVWDENVGNEDYYQVNSVYMDSREFLAHHEKLDGLMDRKKLRLRWYGETGLDAEMDLAEISTDVFFELKRKSGDVILKDRFLGKEGEVGSFLEDPFRLLGEGGAVRNEFVYEYACNRMRPVIFVSYKRRPLFSKFDERFRLTFDYELRMDEIRDLKFFMNYGKVLDDLAIMEVKFNEAMPKWFHRIIEANNLNKDTFSKYCRGVEECLGLPSYY